MPNNVDRRLWMYSIGDVGLEIEFTNINRNLGPFVNEMNMAGLQVVHDASNETPRLCIQNLSVRVQPGTEDFNLLAGKLRLNHSVVGGELVSGIYFIDDDTWKRKIHTVTGTLSKYGETEICTRDSLHVHVNIGNAVDHRILIRLLNMSMAYEYILYKLGGMGCINRGAENSFIYQRPYTPKGPPVVKNRYNYPIFYVEDLLNTKNKVEFFDTYGDSGRQADNNNRYVTQRYMGINFYSVLVHGSLEFRHANKTLNPEWIIAWSEFCSAFVKKAFFQSPDETEFIMRPLTIGGISDSDFIDVINSFAFLSKESSQSLIEIWKRSEEIHYEDAWTYSHLKNPTFYENRDKYYPKTVPSREDIVTPSVYTVHELNANFTESVRYARELYNGNKVKEVAGDLIDVMLRDRDRREKRALLNKVISNIQTSIINNNRYSVFETMEIESLAGEELKLGEAYANHLNFDSINFYLFYEEYGDDDDDVYCTGEFCIRLYSHNGDHNKYSFDIQFNTKDEDCLSLNYRELFNKVTLILEHNMPNVLHIYFADSGEMV